MSETEEAPKPLTEEEAKRIARCMCDLCRCHRAGVSYRALARLRRVTRSQIVRRCKKHEEQAAERAGALWESSWRGDLPPEVVAKARDVLEKEDSHAAEEHRPNEEARPA